LIAAYVTFGRYDAVLITEFPNQTEALAAAEESLMQGVFTVEIAEAIALEDFLKAVD
jgi:uncharacterized protein with GYD domain